MNLVEVRRRGEHSEAGCYRCRFRRREGSKPAEQDNVSLHMIIMFNSVRPSTYPHGRMQRASNLIVLLQSWTTTQNLRQPKLTDSALHVTNFALSWLRRLDPLRRLTSDTTHHVGVCESFWCALSISRCCQLRSQRLSDAGVQRRRPGRDCEVALSSTPWTRCPRPSTLWP